MDTMYDVVVVGKGIAGLSAALAAADESDKVLIISDSEVGSTFLAKKGVFRFTPDKYDLRNKIINNGENISKPEVLNLFTSLVESGQERLKDIFNLKQAEHVGKKVEGGGANILTVLENIVISRGVEIANGMVIRILTSDKKVSALQVISNSNLITIRAKSVVIACGGVNSVYSKTDNVPLMSVLGCSLALEAGAFLRDMEFLIFHPFSSLNERISFNARKVYTFFDLQKTELFNEEGKRLYAVEDLINSGGAHKYINLVARQIFSNKTAYFFRNGEKVMLEPAYHSLVGGIDTDSSLMTCIGGLFAAGESMGGLNGADRMAGMSMMEGFVLGSEAGKQAAIYSNKNALNKIDEEKMIPSTLNMGFVSEDIIDSIHDLTDKFLFIERDGENLNYCLEKLKLIMGKIDLSSISGYLERSVVLSAMAIAGASLIRKESRGAYYRSDYPKKDDSMERSIIVSYANEFPDMKFVVGGNTI